MSNILLVTQSFPPSTGGTATLVWQLVKYWDPEKLIVVHSSRGINVTEFKCFPVTFLSQTWTDRLMRKFGFLYSRVVANRLTQIVKKNKISHVYLHYPNAPFVVAGCRVAKKFGIPYSIFFDILWEERASGVEKKLSFKYEGDIVSGAINCFAITDFSAKYLSDKHQKPFKIIPHTTNSISKVECVKQSHSISSGEIKIIHFAGGIYSRMNLDSLERIYKTLNEMSINFKFEIFSKQLPDIMTGDSRVSQEFVSREELIERQRQSDLLVLPQAFNSTTPLMIRNNLPTKTMEYIISGTPILVHSPGDSYLTWLIDKYDAGFIASSKDIEELKIVIHSALYDDENRNAKVNGAFKLARTRNSQEWSETLLGYLNG